MSGQHTNIPHVGNGGVAVLCAELGYPRAGIEAVRTGCTSPESKPKNA